jgi:glycosyltransferase involved in cell wall biosynthesis
VIKANRKYPFKNFFVISHDASLSGAPVLLLSLMQLLKEKGYIFNSLVAKRGPLLNSFREISEMCEVFDNRHKESLITKFQRKVLRKKVLPDIKPLLKGVDCVISNTITNGELLGYVRKYFKGPIISYIHELEMVTDLCTTKYTLDETLSLTDHFMVDCTAIKSFLHEKHKIDEKSISIINSYKPRLAASSPKDVEAFRESNKIKSSFVVGAIGFTEWRKGNDIFIIIASLVFKKMPDADIQFLWMGGAKAKLENKQMAYDIKRLKLNEKIILVDSSSNINLLFKNIHLFLLTSREDPYPLVVLDAAAEKIPTICFSQAGGAPEFIGEDAGTVIEYLDILSAADQICNYYTNRHLLHSQGIQAYNKVIALHHDKDLVVNQFRQALENIL